MTTTQPLPELTTEDPRWWFTHLTRYHWFVLIMCALAWMFDCADQMIFTLTRSISMRDLLADATPQHQNLMGSWATFLFMMGWATGGLIFGVVGDRWGRAKTMTLTVFLYATLTGISALSQNWWQFAMARCATGFGVGGVFAAGAALVADVMPSQARAQALGLLQALSAIGNLTGAFSLQIVVWLLQGNPRLVHLEWRYLYCLGALPALLAVFVMSRMKEPDKWVKAKQAAIQSGNPNLGRIGDLFRDATLRRNTFVGIGLAIAGIVGLWGVVFYAPELIDSTFPQMSPGAASAIEQIIAMPDASSRVALLSKYDADSKTKGVRPAYKNLLSRTAAHGENVDATMASGQLSSDRIRRINGLLDKHISEEEGAKLKSKGSMLQQIGAFFGMFAFSVFATRIGRRPTFILSFIAAWASILISFLMFQQQYQVYYLYPLMGFCALLPFGGYAVYFPELFPTRLRTTGTGFCYNVTRYIASIGPLAIGALTAVFAGRFAIQGFRVAAVVVASVYIIGIVSAFYGPETKGKPLPEDTVPAH